METAKSETRDNETLLHEYPAIGKYRLRVIRKETRRSKQTFFDLREYVSAEKFEGFTRRGIRINTESELRQVQDALMDALGRGWFDPDPEKGAA